MEHFLRAWLSAELDLREKQQFTKIQINDEKNSEKLYSMAELLVHLDY